MVPNYSKQIGGCGEKSLDMFNALDIVMLFSVTLDFLNLFFKVLFSLKFLSVN